MTKGNSFILRYQSSRCPNPNCQRSRVGRAHLRAIFLTHFTSGGPASCSSVSIRKSSESDETIENLAKNCQDRISDNKIYQGLMGSSREDVSNGIDYATLVESRICLKLTVIFCE